MSTRAPHVDQTVTGRGQRRPYLARVRRATFQVALISTLIGVASAVVGGTTAFDAVFDLLADVVGLVLLVLIPFVLVAPVLGRRSPAFVTVMVIAPALVGGGFIGLVALNLIARNVGWIQPA